MNQLEARRRWIRAQKLNVPTPFGNGSEATRLAVEHLGYVQIDTINVIERSHHHILFNRIPEYKIEDLNTAQTIDKSVFEYWTHALAYVPTLDYRFFMRDMKHIRKNPHTLFGSVSSDELNKVLKQIKKEGALSVRDMKDDELVEKTHPWGSRKPSKKALQRGFWEGSLVISERLGMLKKYEWAERHFAWLEKPKAATEKEIHDYLLDRALRSQALVSLESVCYLEPSLKPKLHKIIEQRMKKKELIEIKLEGNSKDLFWIRPAEMENVPREDSPLTHLLSPFDPLVIQRKRLHAFFDYEHRFEAYLPKEKRKLGYFALPVLMGNEIVAALDLKTDRPAKKLLIQKWTWLPKQKSPTPKKVIEDSLHAFEKFQLRVRA
jgi:uncharacterized protein YcaQ